MVATVEDFGQLLREHGDDHLDYLTTCTKCGRVFIFHSIGTSCGHCPDGTLRPITRYVETTTEAETDEA